MISAKSWVFSSSSTRMVKERLISKEMMLMRRYRVFVVAFLFRMSMILPPIHYSLETGKILIIFDKISLNRTAYMRDGYVKMIVVG